MTERTGLPYPPRGMCREDAALYIGVGTTTFDRLVEEGRMPKPIRISKRDWWGRAQLDEAFSWFEHEGTIYVIQALPGSPIKVGFTLADDVSVRLARLQTGNPNRLRVLSTARGAMAKERVIHAALAVDRLTGEWFSWTERTARFVALMPRGIGVALAGIGA